MGAIDKAIYYLNIKPRTRCQLIDYLTRKEFSEEEIEEAVRQLEEYRYIDDETYSMLYFERGFETGRGIARIKRELAQKGVDRQMIDSVLAEMEDVPDQYRTALETGEKIMREIGDYDPADRQKIKAKIARRLGSKGFTADIVYRVIRELME